MSHAAKRTERLRQLERYYLSGAYTDEELAELLGVGSRATIYKDRQLLTDEGVPFEEVERGRWKIDRTRYLSTLRVSLYESAMLYLMARRAARQARHPNPHVTSVLKSVALTLNRPMMERLLSSADFVPAAGERSEATRILEKIVRCWVDERKVRIRYQALHAANPTLHLISPYLLEPSLVDEGIYVVAYSETLERVVPFKLSRIQAAADTTQPVVPRQFDENRLMREAWGIWTDDGEPQRVRLHFRGRDIVRRVQETIWHPAQEPLELLGEDACIWTARVSAWQEMLPWVRGWGADCEVLEPAEMRNTIAAHILSAAMRYGVLPEPEQERTVLSDELQQTRRLLRLWGKTTADPNLFHPALYHMLDVGHVAQLLLQPPASPRWRRVLGDVLGAEPDRLHEWLPCLIALHDIGKLSIPFQVQNKSQQERLRAEGFGFGRYRTADHRDLHHTVVGRLVLAEWLKQKALHPYLHRAFQEMLTGHHGWYGAIDSHQRRAWQTLAEPDEWQALRSHALDLLTTQLSATPAPDLKPSNISAAIAAFNGFTILCDWLASDGAYFTPHPHTMPETYRAISRRAAAERVASAGLIVSTVSTARPEFRTLFGFAPRPLQEAVERLPAARLTGPSLTIIEAPTGEGKTEAALALARRIAAQRGHDEMYIALPTTATSNAMYARIQRYLTESLGLPNLVKLVHGQDFLESALRIDRPLDDVGSGPHPALSWFSPRKQALLAPFGVGTIDQAELSALNVRHNALRLLGLAGKVVILDEVHAYDVYMSTIIARMLAWLAAHGTSVILLSATLPAAQRQRLVDGFVSGLTADGAVEHLPQNAYPVLLNIAAGVEPYHATAAAFQPNRVIALTLSAEPTADRSVLAGRLLATIRDGGCVCYIANTVRRAQQLFAAVRAQAESDTDLLLLHARFPLEDRQRIEQMVLARYGKSADGAIRPKRGVVIGTQVLEQSLDLDFDVMYSDLAPIDLLLQRAGRLHRHADRTDRAPNQTAPHLIICYRANAEGTWQQGDDRFYSELIMRRTLALLRDRTAVDGVLRLPQDYRPLIETVYDETPPEPADPLYPAWRDLQKRQVKLEEEARLRLTAEPKADEPFTEGSNMVFDEEADDEGATDWSIAQTRYRDQRSLTVIPLERIDATTGGLPNGVTIPLDLPANRALQLQLRRRQITVNDRRLVNALPQDPAARPSLCTQSALLKHCYLLLLTADQRACVLPDQVRLDKTLGLIYGSDEDRKDEGS